MKKLSAFLVVAALAAAPAALAKERNLSMTAAPASPKAGQAWMLTIKVTIDAQAVNDDAIGPMVRVVNAAGKTRYVHSQATDDAGVFQARIVFARAGTYRVLVVDRYSGRAYPMRPVRVRAV